MMRFAVVAVLLGASALANAETPKELIGRYQMELAGGGDILELRADGSASMAGDETRWSAHAGQLTVGTDVMGYQLAAGKLTLSMGTVQIAWKRIGAPGKAKVAAPAAADDASMDQAQPAPPSPPAPARGHAQKPPAADAAPPGGNSQDAQARQLLTSSAWCSFTYNKVSGTSTTQRVVYRADGTVTSNDGRESYNSGNAGSYASQSANSGSARWKLENLHLYIDLGNGAGFQDIGLTAERNSSGYPILHALGREYSMCN